MIKGDFSHMKKQTRCFGAVLTAAVLCGSLCVPLSADAAYGVGGNGTAVMEYLNRGICAVKSGNGMLVSWRFNADDNDNAEFHLLRGGELIYTSKAGDPTCYYDAGGSTSADYTVETYVNGKKVGSESCKFTSGSNYFEIPLSNPNPSVYSPNDCCAGDVDGDGQYEIFVKWDPNNSQDNSQSGYTDNVYIDCVTLEGKRLWRINLGKNIRAGQHYTQMCVADFDCDGSAELITKTSDGTTDGTGKVLGNANADYRNSGGYVLTGSEWLTLFDGQTGAALDTIDFPVPRGDATSNAAKTTWGDNYGNRVDRFNGAIAYLDGVHPSAVYGRGYYTRLTLSAVDVVDKKLVKRWVFDTGFDTSNPAYGCGNHNVMVADFDNDGKQEVCMGACCIDDNGKLLWSTKQLHGDAMHIGDLDPNHEGIEVFICHEDGKHGISLVDGRNGQIIWHYDGDKDTGRCCADNIVAGNSGAEFWGSRPANAVFDVSGTQIGNKWPATNFLIYWDGDLEREMLDNITITDGAAINNYPVIFTATGCASNNGTKAVPCMTGDLFGDWREELVLRTEDNSKLRVYCTDIPTEVRLTTLMHDMQYRMQNGCQQSAYNQPPHVSYYLGSEAPLPARPNVIINGKGGNNSPVSGNTYGRYVLRNLNSGLYLGADGDAADGAAIVQKSANAEDDANLFTFEQVGETGYVIHSAADDSLVLTYSGSGGITLAPAGSADAQTFELYRSGSGYHITPAGSEGARCVEVKNASADAGEVVQLWEDNGHDCQKWALDAVTVHTARAMKYLAGDLNGDEKVNAADFTLLKRELLNPRMDTLRRQTADLNADGKVTLADAVIMQKFLLTQGKLEAAEENKALYYALDAGYSQGIEESTNEGFTERAYINLANEIGSALTWKVYVREAGSYAVTFRFANGGNAARPMTVSVNGGAGSSQNFDTTGAWTSWAENGMTVTLKAGMNTIRLTSETADGGPNFDWLKLAGE